MKWNNQTKLAFSKTRGRKVASGISCLFVRLSPKIGVKIFWTAAERNYAYKAQQFASKYGLGPRVGDKLTISARDKKLFLALKDYRHKTEPTNWWNGRKATLYGYITQVASIPQKGLTDKEHEKLCHKLELHGFATCDMHEYNVGRINGKAVCIDFDPVTMGAGWES